MSKEIVIVEGTRTPFAKMGTAFAGADAPKLSMKRSLVVYRNQPIQLTLPE